jgi:radical SAM-linked protein
MGHETPIKQRLNITFGKFGALKYTGNLDVAKIWERVLRRADLPILYTQGFNTRPRIQLASALPLGITSECEILDVSLREPILLEGLAARLLEVSPPGLRIYQIDEVPVRSPALQALVRSAEYIITLEDGYDPDNLQARIDRLLDAEQILRERRGKKRTTTVDIRPLIHELRIDEEGRLRAHVACGERSNLRPMDLIEELGLSDEYHTIHRQRLHLERPTQT